MSASNTTANFNLKTVQNSEWKAAGQNAIFKSSIKTLQAQNIRIKANFHLRTFSKEPLEKLRKLACNSIWFCWVSVQEVGCVTQQSPGIIKKRFTSLRFGEATFIKALGKIQKTHSKGRILTHDFRFFFIFLFMKLFLKHNLHVLVRRF